MATRILLIFNMRSGKGSIKTKLAQLIDEFDQADCEITVFSTRKSGDAKEIILQHAEQADMVVCSGGDGTINDAIAGIRESGRDLPLLFIPSGSTNDYAVTLRIPKDPLKAIDRFHNGEIMDVDIGRFNGRTFNYIASFGLLTDIAYTTDQTLKNILGYAAYIIEVPKRLIKIPVLHAHVEADNGITFDDGWFYAMVTNAKQVGGLKNITGPDVILDDGLFEVTLVRATTNPIEFLEAFNAITTGGSSRFIERFKTEKIRFVSEEPIAWTLDGEPGGEHTEVFIENIHNAVKIVVPKD